MRTTAAVVGALLLTAACNSDQDPTIDMPVASTTTTSAATTSADTAGPSTTFAGGTTPVSVPSTGGKRFLTDVRAAAQPGFERVAFEFRDGVPGYQVRYVSRPIHEDGSGDQVEVAGGAVIEVRMEPASGFDTEAAGDGAPTYTGPKRIDPATTAVTEMVRTGDHEAVLTWVIGVDRQRPFKVGVSSSPKPVLFVDISAS